MVMAVQTMLGIDEKSLPMTNLTVEEEQLLQRQVLSVDGEIAYGNGFLQDLFRSHAPLIMDACRAAKFAFGNVNYKGLSADDGSFGVSLILPEHVLRTTAAVEAPALDWTFTFTADGDYWIGFGSDNDEAIHIDKRALVVVLALTWTQGWAPIVEKVSFQQGGRTAPYQNLRHGWWGDNTNRIRAARLRPMVWGPKDTVLAQTYQLVAGQQQMQLLGLTFAKGDLLRTQAPTAVEV